MPDLIQALRDFVATSNSGKYKTEDELLSKFPELKGYDVNALRDFVATSNSGKYKTEDELLSKFPEFSGAPVDTQPVKKKDEAYTTPLWQQPQGQPEPEPRQEQTLPFLESKPSGFSLESQRVPEEEVAQRPVAPYRQPLIDESLPELKTAEEIQEIVNRPEYKEQTYFTGGFGDVLKWMDTPSGISRMNPFPKLGIGEMIDDFGRAIGTGINTGDIVNTTAPLYIAGKKSSDQEIEAFMSASDVADKLGPSDEMVAFSTQYQESGQDVLGFIDAISSNPGAIPDIMVSSFASMVNGTSIKAGLAVAGTMAATYAGIAAAAASPTGPGALVAGALGAGAGAVASIPYAMGAMGAVLETNLSFGEAVKEKLAADGLSWTKENVRKVLEQDDFLNTARVKAAARGITIGVIDAFTGRIAGKIGANLLKAPGKSALVKSAAASSGIEAVGGSGGEAAARLVTGQEMDVAEIGLEGIGEMPMAVIDVGAAVLNQPVYKVNGEIRTENDVRDLISTATAEELGLIKIDIRNDKKGYNKQIQDKIVTGAIRAEVREVNPNMDDATVDAITTLEEEKNKFSGKKTQSAKDKVASISSQIKTLQENAVQKPSTEESVLRAEESQVGLQEVGEGNAQVQAPAQEVAKEEVGLKSDIEKRRQEKLKNTGLLDWEQDLTRARVDLAREKENVEFGKKPGNGAYLEQAKKMVVYHENQIAILEKIEDEYNKELAALEQPTEEVVDEDLQATFDRLLSLDETEAVAEQPALSEDSQKIKTQLEDFQNAFDEAYNAEYPKSGTAQDKRSATAKSKKAVKKLQQMIGFDIGAYWELDADQTKKREALYSLRENKDYDSYDEMVAAYQKDVAEGNQSELVTSINTLLGVAPKEMEAVSPATPVVEDIEGTTKALEGKDWTPPSQVDNINTFPLLKGTDVVRYIPESVAQKAWEYWDREFETGQTLQRAKERGGFSVSEMNMFYPNWRAESSKINAKEQTSKSVVPPAPKVSSKIPKAKSLPIPVAIPKPAPAPAPKPVAVEGKFKKLKSLKDIQEDPRVESIYKERDDEGVSWWIELKDGYEWAYNSQIIHEYTVNGLLGVMNNDVQAVAKTAPQTTPTAVAPAPTPAPKPVAIKKGVQELFESTPELTRIGTVEQYINYLNFIFPESKVKDIVYHGTDNINFNKFYQNLRSGIHFGTMQQAKGRRTATDTEFKNDFKFLPVLLNLKNPLKSKDFDWEKAGDAFTVDWTPDTDLSDVDFTQYLLDNKIATEEDIQNSDGDFDIINKKGYDGVVYKNEGAGEATGEDSFAVSNTEQIHILGNKQDIEGFKKFVTQPSTSVKAPAPAPKPVAVVSQPQEDVKIYSYNGKNYEIKRLSVKDVDTGRLLTLGFGEIVKENGKLLTPAAPVVAKAKTKAAPKAKVEPVKVAPAIVSKPAPASKPVIVPAPTTIVGPVQLRDAYIDNANSVRTDKTLTQRQKDAKVDALKVEYQARKAEMESTTPSAAKPKTEAKAKTKAAPKKVEPVKVVSKKDEVAIQQLENDIEYAESEIENAKEEIGNTEYNLKEALAEIEKKRDALENKKMSDAAREEANEDLDLEETNAEENYDDEIKKYNDELKEARKDKKKAERRLAKLTGAPAIEVMEEDGPSLEDLEEVDDIVDEDEDGDEFESIKDLDPKVESVGKRVIDRINKLDAALVKHSKSSLNSGIAIPTARLILKAIKGFIKLGMTVNQAIVRVAAEMNLEKKDIIESLKELDAIYLSQSALAKVRAQVNLEVTAALASKRSVNEKRKALSDAIKAMAVTGDIASTKVQTLLNRIGKINLDNPVAVENFLKYVENVFNDAAYDTELAGLRAKVAKAKTNVGTKLGTAEGITPLINRLLSIKPSLIPAQLLDSYREIIEMFGSSDAVLVLGNIDDVTTQIQELLDGIDEYLSVIPELTELISDYGNRVLNKDGSLNYQETLVKMLADKTITEEQYNIMRKYKSLIVSKETKPTKTKEEDAQEKKVLLEALSQTDVDMSAVIGNDEKKMAARLIKLAKSSAANILTNRQLLNLLKVFDNINNGYFPHYANKLYVELEAAHKVGFLTNALLKASNRVGFLTKTLLKAKMPKLAEYATKLRSVNREAIFDRIKNIPLFNIDEVFGDFKTKEFFNTIFDQLASAQQVYNIEVEKIGKKLDAMSDRISKSYGENHNGFVEAKMKMAIYRIQREFKSNPGDARVNPALAYINKTLEAIKEGSTMYSDRDAKLLKEIATEYSKGTGENATIDNEKLFASFTSTEKAALKLFDDINKSLQSLAVFTGDVIRGDQVHLLVDYNHLNVLPGKKQASSSLAEASEKFNPSSVASTKAGSLIERTAGVKAINFDIFSTVERGANHVLLDYHLTNPVRIARRAISLTRQQIEDSDDGSKATSNQLDMLGAISDAVELALKAMLDSALVKDSVADMIAKDLARTGYRAMLAGIPRASVELASNMSYVAIAARKEYAKGISIGRKNKSVVWGERAVNVMRVAGAKTMSRVIGSDSLTGRIVDSSVLSKRTKRSSTILTPVENTILSYHNKSTKKFKNGVEYIADNLISSPDKIMMRPLWFGSFANAFESITGVEVDFDKMNNEDVDYLIEYRDAINSATNVADEKVAMAGNVDNPFMNSLRSFIPSEAGALEKTYKVFNNFMNKFMIGEFLVFRKGAHALMRDGSISRKQGVALMAAVVTRMTVYSVMLSLVSQFVYGLFTDDEDEDDQKSFDKKLGQGLASTATSLLLGRTYGNLVRTGINAGVELFNEEYLDGLREGDYDPYKDAIQYTFIQPGTTGKGVDLGDVFTAIAGPYAPAMKTASFALKTLGAADKKEDAAIERADDEKYYRLPLEIFGNLGYVPLYKDIRTIVNKNIYAALDKELKKQEKKKASGGDDKEKESDFKPMGLNRVDLKRYYPEIYEQYYGEGSEAEATRKIEYEKNRLEREIKDERYGYIPKKRSKKREKTRSKVRDTKRRGGR